MSFEVLEGLDQAADLAKSVLSNPNERVRLALLHLLKEVQSGSATLSPEDFSNLRRLIAEYEQKSPNLQNGSVIPIGPVESSVLELCGYKEDSLGFNNFHIPQGMSIIQIFEMANTQCEILRIDPAVCPLFLNWWNENTSAHTIRIADEHHKVLGFDAATLYKGRDEQNEMLWDNDFRMPSIEATALENVLTHIATRGRVDSFKGNYVRTEDPQWVLYRAAIERQDNRPGGLSVLSIKSIGERCRDLGAALSPK